MSLEAEVVGMSLHRDSNLLAVSLADFSLVVLDVVGKQVARKFSGHSNQVCF